MERTSLTAMCEAAPHAKLFNCRIKKGIGIRRGNNNVLPILPDLLSCNSLTATQSYESLFQLCSNQLSNQTFNCFFKLPMKISREDGCLCLKNKSFEYKGQNKILKQISGWNALVFEHTFHSVLICQKAPKDLRPIQRCE